MTQRHPVTRQVRAALTTISALVEPKGWRTSIDYTLRHVRVVAERGDKRLWFTMHRGSHGCAGNAESYARQWAQRLIREHG